MRTLTRRNLNNDSAVDAITVWAMVLIPFVVVVLVPLLLWLKAYDVARVGHMKVTQQAALAAAASTKLVTLPDGSKVLRIDEPAAYARAQSYYGTQKNFIRDMFNYPVLGAAGKQEPVAADWVGTGCTVRDADGYCTGYTVELTNYYDGAFFSRWMFHNVPMTASGYAELSVQAERCYIAPDGSAVNC